MGSDEKQILSFQEFWGRYLEEHSLPLNQGLHFLGTTLALVFLVLALVFGDWWFFVAAVFSGYFFAWIGHFWVQKNRPLTFKYPFKSLAADFKMYFLLWRKILLKKPLQ